MSLRLIQAVLPQDCARAFADLPNAPGVVDRWEAALDDNKILVCLLVEMDQTESLLDSLQERFSESEGFRVLLLPVEATLPRPMEAESEESAKEQKTPARISREELYNDIVESAKISRVFIAQVVLATLVAAVGLMRGDTAIIIGAMVIAPLLGPNVSLCLATALGDVELALRSLKTNLLGLAVALSVTLFIGFVFPMDTTAEAIQARTQVSGADIILALASGCAGVLAFTSGAPTALIGVMVAVALLPPFVVFGLLAASGEMAAASGALLLVATNVICVNLAGVVTLVVQGVRPLTWWEVARAKKATRVALATWALLLVLLVALIFLATHR